MREREYRWPLLLAQVSMGDSSGKQKREENRTLLCLSIADRNDTNCEALSYNEKSSELWAWASKTYAQCSIDFYKRKLQSNPM